MNKKPKMKFIATTEAKLKNIEIVPGQLIFVVDNKTIYLDISDTDRTIYTSVVIFDTDEDRLNYVSPPEGFYYVKETNILWGYFNREWKTLNSIDVGESETISLSTDENHKIIAEIKENSIGEDFFNDDVKLKIGKAETAVQSVKEGDINGAILVDGTSVSIHGLGSAAYSEASDFDRAGAAADVIGNALDPSSALTIYGVKALIEESLTWKGGN